MDTESRWEINFPLYFRHNHVSCRIGWIKLHKIHSTQQVLKPRCEPEASSFKSIKENIISKEEKENRENESVKLYLHCSYTATEECRRHLRTSACTLSAGCHICLTMQWILLSHCHSARQFTYSAAITIDWPITNSILQRMTSQRPRIVTVTVQNQSSTWQLAVLGVQLIQRTP
jgi:hypothetical protein